MKVKKIVAFILSLTLIVSSLHFSSVSAQIEKEDGKIYTWIVKVEGDPVWSLNQAKKMGGAEYQSTASGKKQKNSITQIQNGVISDIRDDIKSNAKIGFRFNKLFNGFTIKATKSEAKKISELSHVLGVKKAEKIAKLTDETSESEEGKSGIVKTESGAVLECCDTLGVPEAHAEGYTGKGTVIAVIDSEFDYTHENFSGEPEGYRLGKEDIKDILENKSLASEVSAGYWMKVWKSNKIPYAFNYGTMSGDTLGSDSVDVHGSHTAGIAAGNGGTFTDGTKFKSVAPDAQLALMAIPSLTDDEIMAAYEDCANIGVDVISYSITELYVDQSSYAREVYENAANAGIYMSITAGNNGSFIMGELSTEFSDYGTIGTPGSYDFSTAVADGGSVWKIGEVSDLRVEGAEGEKITCQAAYSKQYSSEEYPQYGEVHGKTLPYIFVEQIKSPDEIEELDIKGKILVTCLHKEMKSLQYLEPVENAGALGIVFINLVTNNNFNFSISDTIVDVMVSPEHRDFFAENPTGNLCLDGEIKSFEERDGTNQVMADYSGWGVNANLQLKPDVTAVGTQVYSSVPDNKYERMNGTSMATPHYAGMVAVMKERIHQKYPDLDVEEENILIKQLFMNTANIVYCDQENKIPASTRQQGAGMVSLSNAFQSSVVLLGDEKEAKLSLGELSSSKITFRVTAKNLSDKDITYDKLDFNMITNTAQDDNNKKVISAVMENVDYTLSNFPQKVTVPAGSEKEITFTASVNEEQLKKIKETFVNGFFLDGFITLGTKDDSVQEIHIPYTGFFGKWDDQDIFDYSFFSDQKVTDGGTRISYTNNCDEGWGVYDISVDACSFVVGRNSILTYMDDEEAQNYDSYNREEYMDVSTKIEAGDGTPNQLCISSSALRKAKDCMITIRDSEGTIIYEKPYFSQQKVEGYYNEDGEYIEPECEDVQKGHTVCADIPLSTFTSGSYSVLLSGRIFGENTRLSTREMKFFIDNQAPVVESSSIVKDGDKTYLEIKCRDNRHLAGAYGRIILDVPEDKEEDEGESEEEDYIGICPVNGTTSDTFKFDVTGLDYEKIEIGIRDYASNELLFSAKEYLDGAGQVKKPENTDKPTPTVSPTATPTASPSVKPQKITIAKIKAVKAKTLKKKSATIKLKAKTDGKGKLTYKVTGYPKKMKKFIKVSKKGVVTLKKKAKKGTYKVTITAAAIGNFKKTTKVVAIKVK